MPQSRRVSIASQIHPHIGVCLACSGAESGLRRGPPANTTPSTGASSTGGGQLATGATYAGEPHNSGGTETQAAGGDCAAKADWTGAQQHSNAQFRCIHHLTSVCSCTYRPSRDLNDAGLLATMGLTHAAMSEGPAHGHQVHVPLQ